MAYTMTQDQANIFALQDYYASLLDAKFPGRYTNPNGQGSFSAFDSHDPAYNPSTGQWQRVTDPHSDLGGWIGGGSQAVGTWQSNPSAYAQEMFGLPPPTAAQLAPFTAKYSSQVGSGNNGYTSNTNSTPTGTTNPRSPVVPTDPNSHGGGGGGGGGGAFAGLAPGASTFGGSGNWPVWVYQPGSTGATLGPVNSPLGGGSVASNWSLQQGSGGSPGGSDTPTTVPINSDGTCPTGYVKLNATTCQSNVTNSDRIPSNGGQCPTGYTADSTGQWCTPTDTSGNKNSDGTCIKGYVADGNGNCILQTPVGTQKGGNTPITVGPRGGAPAAGTTPTVSTESGLIRNSSSGATPATTGTGNQSIAPDFYTTVNSLMDQYK